jgi:ketosteroid isomerase-like protein
VKWHSLGLPPFSALGSLSAIHVNYLFMRQIFSIAVVGLSAAAIASGQQQGATRDPKTSVEQVIRKLDNERIQAQIHADAAALERIYADDFIGVGPSGTVRTKPQVISDFTSGNLKFQSITTDDVRVRVYGDAAVETGSSTMDGQDKGKAVPRDTRSPEGG